VNSGRTIARLNTDVGVANLGFSALADARVLLSRGHAAYSTWEQAKSRQFSNRLHVLRELELPSLLGERRGGALIIPIVRLRRARDHQRLSLLIPPLQDSSVAKDICREPFILYIHHDAVLGATIKWSAQSPANHLLV